MVSKYEVLIAMRFRSLYPTGAPTEKAAPITPRFSEEKPALQEISAPPTTPSLDKNPFRG